MANNQQVGIGAAANDGTGDPLRTAFTKYNSHAHPFADLTDPEAIEARIWGANTVNALDYCTGDGATDDTAALHSACAAAGANGVVIFPDATYLTDEFLVDENGLTLIFGRRAKIQLSSDPAIQDHAMNITGTNVWVFGGQFDAARSTWVTGGTDHNAINIQADGCRVYNAECTNAQYGVLSQASDTYLINNKVVGTSVCGLAIRAATTSTVELTGKIIGNFVDNSGETATSYTTGGIKMLGNNSITATQSKMICANNHVYNPIHTDTNSGQICIESWGLAKEVVIANNVTSGGSMGISVHRTSNPSVTGNVCTDWAANGIEMVEDTNNFTVTGNSVITTIDAIVDLGASVDSNAIALNSVQEGTVSANAIETVGVGVKHTTATGDNDSLMIVGNTMSNCYRAHEFQEQAGGQHTNVFIENNVYIDCGKVLHERGTITNDVNNFTFCGNRVVRPTGGDSQCVVMTRWVSGIIGHNIILNVDAAGDASTGTFTGISLGAVCSDIQIVHNVIKGLSGVGGVGISTNASAANIKYWGNVASNATTAFSWGAGSSVIST